MGVAPNNCNRSLADWIALLRVKQLNFKCRKRKNLFIEAVLNKALGEAQTELRRKQHARKLRWMHLKSSLGESGGPMMDLENKTCQDLTDSLDQFMLQLKSVNVPVQR